MPVLVLEASPWQLHTRGAARTKRRCTVVPSLAYANLKQNRKDQGSSQAAIRGTLQFEELVILASGIAAAAATCTFVLLVQRSQSSERQGLGSGGRRRIPYVPYNSLTIHFVR